MVAKGKSKRKPTAWSLHIKETMKAHPDMLLKDVLKLAGKTYKKGKEVVTDVGKTVGKTVEGVAKKTRKTLKTKLHVGGKKTKTQKGKTQKRKTQKRKTQKRKTQKRKTQKSKK
tara:strand:+ start:214 stop:555 length:342 start_codon:yes stop_codon:yes gene_type:complete